jgi:hypothetical protein
MLSNVDFSVRQASELREKILTADTVRPGVAESTGHTGLADLVGAAVVWVPAQKTIAFDKRQYLRLTQT